MDKYTVVGQLKAQPGKRDELARMMLESDTLHNMEGCIFYILNESLDDPDVLWILELWESPDAHAASLKDEKVLELIQRCRPFIAGGEPLRMRPLGGKGL